jgi:hypothetical protein
MGFCTDPTNKTDAHQYLNEKAREACPEGMDKILDFIQNIE